MTKGFKMLALAGGLMALSACAVQTPVAQAYWQRVEDNSALWMTGPKAQQQLDQDLAGCVREVDELVELGALRETTPPDTHSEYHRALDASGDLSFYDTPTRLGNHKVSHTDYHDFESCMRVRGWERVRFVRYDAARQAQKTHKETQQLRVWGVSGAAADQKVEEQIQAVRDSYTNLNQ
ncbi:MAG TPA: hypothetical protein PLX33_01465 [Alphaproteobacteria bacterium]|nr:hypothetical protein [Alphaproteobacteria bacterium]